MRYHFIAGLPRAGSTALSATLNQNPRFSADVSSPILPLATRMIQEWSGHNEASALVKPDAQKRMLKGLFDSYYHGKDVVFDTNRYWTNNISIIAELFPQAKIICMVRPIGEIMNSLERQAQLNPLQISGIFGEANNASVFNRISSVENGNSMVGKPLDGLRQAFFGPHSKKLILIGYRTFATYPAKVMERLYEALGEEPFEHDFDNVEFHNGDLANFLKTPHLHKVRRKIEYGPQDIVIPPSLFNRYANDLDFLKESSDSTII